MLRNLDFKMRILSFRLRIALPIFAVSMALATLSSAVGRADVMSAPGTESSAGGVTDAWLVARGLIGSAMISEQSGTDTLTPPPGTEVSETRQTANLTGEVLNQVKSWNEIVADDTIQSR